MRLHYVAANDYETIINRLITTVSKKFLSEKKLRSFEDAFNAYWSEMNVGNQNALKRMLGANLKEIRNSVVKGVRGQLQHEIDMKALEKMILENNLDEEN